MTQRYRIAMPKKLAYDANSASIITSITQYILRYTLQTIILLNQLHSYNKR